MAVFPRQKLTRSQKTEQWGKDCVDAIYGMSDFGAYPGTGINSRRSYRELVQRCYDYYNGIIDSNDYKHVLEPYGKARKNFPATLENHPIIFPIINLLIGEKWKRPIHASVAVLNPDVTTRRTEVLQKELKKNLEAHFLNEVKQRGVPTNEPTQEVAQPEEVVKVFNGTYRDERAIRGEKALKYIRQHCDMDYQIQRAWFHWLVSGQVVSLRGISHNEPTYEPLNPLEIDGDKDPNVEFYEDGNWAIHSTLVHRNTIVDEFYDVLTPSEIESLENPEHSADSITPFASNQLMNRDARDARHYVERVRVFWRSMRKIGIVKYLDETGVLAEKEVNESYIEGEGEKIEWHWESEVWEGYRIDKRIYKRVRALPIQRRKMDNRSSVKLPLNGRRYSDVNSDPISLVMLMIPFQLQYNIFKYRLENSIAKSKDIIGVFDINMLPAKEGWDMDKFMYYLDATGIAWVDYNKEGIKLNHQQQTVLDLSIKVIEQYITLLESIVQEMERTIGVSRQRQGMMSAYEGKGTSQQSIVQSSHITEDLFAKFSKFEEKDYQAMIDYSKIAWVNGKKAHYVLPDTTQEYLEIDPIDYMESELGIYVSTSITELEKLESIKSLAQAMAQNGASFSTLISVMESSSVAEAKEKVLSAETQLQEAQEAAQKQQEQLVLMQQEAEKMKMENENAQKEADRAAKIEVARIQAESQQTIAEMRLQGDYGTKNVDENALEREKLQKQTQLKEKELRDKNILGHRALDIEKMELETDAELRQKEIDVKRITTRPVSTNGSK